MLEAAFWQSIQEAPDDDAPRLIYSDWLEEQDDPSSSARAEFIRVQCELARLADEVGVRRNELEDRERALWKKHGKAWSAPLKPFSNKFAFVRGFPDQVLVHGSVFVQHAEAVLSAAPVFSIRLRKAKGQLAEIGKMPALKRLISLSLYWNQMGQARAQEFFKSPHLGRLHELDMNDNGIRQGGLLAVLSADMPKLRSLNLRNNDLGDEGLRQVAVSPLLAQLHTLKYPMNGATDDSVTELVRSPNVANLTELDLANNSRIGDATAQAIASSPHLTRLRHLNLSDCVGLTADGARALASARGLANLESLELAGNTRIGDAGYRALVESPHLAALTSLNLNGYGIGEGTLKALAAAPFLDRLTSLSLGGSGPANVSAWKRFFGCDRFARLRQFNLGACELGESGVEALASTPSLSGLRTLGLYGACGPRGVVALAASPHFTNLAELDLAGIDFGQVGVPALVASTGFPRLRKLSVSYQYSSDRTVGVDRAGFEALVGRFGKDVVERAW